MTVPSPRRPARLGLEPLEARDNPATNFAAFGAAPGGLPLVEVLRPDGTLLTRFSAFEDTFTGGVRATTAELDGNPNTLELIAAPGPGGGPVVKVFQIDLASARVVNLATFFAMNADFRGGLHVAAGNVAGPDARQEIIVGAGDGGGPRVQVFGLTNGVVTQAPGPLGDFFAMDPNFRGGVRVAAGEVDGNLADGDELVTAAGPTGGPRVQVFRSDGALLADFFAFRSDFQGGVQVSFGATTVLGTPGGLQIDALTDDPSQRNADLNAAALAGTNAQVAATPTAATVSVPTTFGVPGFNTTPTGPGATATTTSINPFGTTALGTAGFGTAPFGTLGFGTTGVGLGAGTNLGTAVTGATVTPMGIGAANLGTTAPAVGAPTAAFPGFVGATGVGTNPGIGVTAASAVTTAIGTSPVTAAFTTSPVTAAASGTGSVGATLGTVVTQTPFSAVTAAGTATVFGPFGDPGPLLPFPALATPPFTGVVIGGTTVGVAVTV